MTGLDRPRPPPALGVAVVALVTALGASARAQSEGTRIGEGRLHASVEADSHYVYNPGYAPRSNALWDIYFVVRPRLRYELPSDVLELNLNADAEYRRYLGLDNPMTGKFSTWAGHFGGTGTWNRQGALSLRFNESLGRQADALNLTQATRLEHVTNDLGVGVDFKPGGGALVLTGDYGLWIDKYVKATELDNVTHRVGVRGLWKFLPRTALFVEVMGLITTYPGPDIVEGATSYHNPETNMVTVDVSATGAVTPRINALVKLGYADTLISGDRLRTVVGQLEGEYSLTGSTKARLGFVRTLLPTSYFKYVAVNRPYGTLEQIIFDNTSLDLRLDYSWLAFGHAVVPDTLGAYDKRDDSSVGIELGVEHRLRGWLSVALRERFEKRTSDWAPPSSTTKVGYTVNDVTLRLIVYLDAVAAVIAR
jgi:hypothetical protein